MVALQGVGYAVYFIYSAAVEVPELWLGFGFFEPKTSLERAQIIVPPVLVGVFSLVFLGLMGRIRLGGERPVVSPLFVALFSCSLLVVGAWVPSIFGAVFFLGFCALILAYAMKQRMSRILDRGIVAGLFGAVVALQFLLFQIYQIEGVAARAAPYAKWMGVAYYAGWVEVPYTTVLQLLSFVFALMTSSFLLNTETGSAGGLDDKTPRVLKQFIGAHGWMIALIATALIVVLINSAFMVVLLLIVYVGMWISPRYKVHVATRLVCMLVTALLAIASYGFNVASYVTDLDQSVAFEYMGLRLLNPFVVYVLAEGVCIGLWAVHWRWRVADVVPASHMDDVTFYMRWMKSYGVENVDDFSFDTWQSGEKMCQLLLAIDNAYRLRPVRVVEEGEEEGEDGEGEREETAPQNWQTASTTLQQKYGISVPADGTCDALVVTSQLYLRSASPLRVFASFFQANFYKVALLFCFLAGSVDTSLINFGFIAIMLTFLMVSADWRRQLWIFAVAYAQIVTLALYLWQFSFTNGWNSEWTRLIGLISYPNVWGILWHILAMAFLVLQLFVYRYRSDRLAKVTLEETQSFPYLLKYLLYTLHFFVHRFAIWAVFLATFLVVTLEYASITSALFLLLISILIGSRFVSRKASYFLWPILLLLSFVIFLTRFVCALPQIYDMLLSADTFFPVSQVGILNRGPQLVFWLAGPMSIFALGLFQWEHFSDSLERPLLYKISLEDMPGTMTGYARKHYPGSFFVLIQFVKRLMLIHVANILALLGFSVAIVQVGAIGAVYVVGACAALRFGFGNALGVLLTLFTVLILPLELLFEIPFLRTRVPEAWSTWIGLVEGNGPLIIAFSVLVLLRCESFVRTHLGEDDEISGKPLFLSQAKQAQSERLTLVSFVHVCTDFFSSIFLNYSIEIISLMILLNVFLRLTVVSILQLVVLVIVLLVPRRVSIPILQWSFLVEVVFVLVQYFFLLGLPPAAVADPKPWLAGLTEAQAIWFSVLIEPAGLLISDFVLALLLSLLARNQRVGMQMRRAKERSGSTDYILAETEPLLLQEVSSAEEDDFNSAMLVLGGAAQQKASSLKSEEVVSWAEAKYAAANVSQYLLLLMVFVAGAAGADLLSLFYICFSLCFLLFVDWLLERPGLWRVVQVYAFLVLFLKLIYQIPYFEINNQLVVGLLGVSKLNYVTAFSSEGVIFDVLIVMLITLQFLILESDVYLNQVRISNKLDKSTSRVLLRNMRRALVQKWVAILREQVGIARAILANRDSDGPAPVEPSEDDSEGVGAASNDDDVEDDDKAVSDTDTFEKDAPKVSLTDFGEKGKNELGDAENKDSGNDSEKVELDETPDGEAEEKDLKAKLEMWFNQFLHWCFRYPWGNLQEGGVPKQPLRALAQGLLRVASFNTDKLCYFCFVLDATLNANIFGIMYPIVAFLYANVMYPLPKRKFWNLCMMFAVGTLIWKFIWRLTLFCVCNGKITISADTCQCIPEGISWDSLVGVSSTYGAFVMDIVLLLVLVLHRSSLRKLGLWSHVSSYWRGDGNGGDSSHPVSRELPSEAAKRSELSRFEKVKYWFHRAFARVEPSSDYYPYTLIAETASFLVLVFFPQDFSGLSELNNDAVRNVLTSNQIPLVYLLILMTQFMFIIVDRGLYLRQSSWGKYLFMVLQVLLVHAVFFFILPVVNQLSFLNSSAVIVVYLLKCCWFYFSGRQIRDGYPITLERNLTSSFSVTGYYIYIVYRAIPFLYELKTILEWATTPTTLEFFHWFILDDVKSELFQCECRWKALKAKDRPFGTPQKWYLKILVGGGLVLALALLLWVPLFLFSSSNPLLQSNPVTKAELSIGLRGWEPLYVSQTSEITSPNSTVFDKLREFYRGIVFNSDAKEVQFVRFPKYAETVWNISPEGYKALRESLQVSVELGGKLPVMEITLSFSRNAGAISDFLATSLSLNETEHFLNVLDYSINCTVPTDPYDDCNAFDALALVPRFVRLPLAPPMLYPSRAPSNMVDARLGITRSVHTFKYRTENETTDEAIVFSEFWGVRDISPLSFFSDSNVGDMVLIVFSQQIPLFFAGSASVGVITLYVTVIFAIGRLIRTAFGNLHTQIQWYFLEDTKPLFNMINQMAHARRFLMLQEDDDFQDLLLRAAEFDDVDGSSFSADLSVLNSLKGFDIEEELYWKVINICRNPQRLIQETTPPEKKVKID